MRLLCERSPSCEGRNDHGLKRMVAVHRSKRWPHSRPEASTDEKGSGPRREVQASSTRRACLRVATWVEWQHRARRRRSEDATVQSVGSSSSALLSLKRKCMARHNHERAQSMHARSCQRSRTSSRHPTARSESLPSTASCRARDRATCCPHAR